MSAELKASRRDATLILTLSNPGAQNALHPDMYAAAIETLSTAERDDSLRAVVLTGADRFFCAGSIEQRRQGRPEHAEAVASLDDWIEAIRDCPKPIIAAVEGGATDAGFALALACDLLIAAGSAEFSVTAAERGLLPDYSGPCFLARQLPRQLANEVLLAGRTLAAQRLYALGLINEIVADGSALDTALMWADQLAALPAAD